MSDTNEPTSLRISHLEHVNSILAERCAAQSREIARLLAKYEPAPVLPKVQQDVPRDVIYRFRAEGGIEMGPKHEHPFPRGYAEAVSAIEVMQRNGVR